MKTISKKYKGIEYTIILDDDDYEYYKDKRLVIHLGRRTNYVRFCFGHSGTEYLHRKITKCPKGMFVDHINSNGLDNRKANLQICTIKENSRKQRKQNRPTQFKYKGISYRENLSKPYRAKLNVNKKHIHLGYFATLEEAANAYNTAVIKYFGKFAIINEVK